MTQTTELAGTAAVPGEQVRRPSGGRWLRPLLAVVVAVALLLAGGGLAVGLGIGRTAQPGADSVDAGFSRDMSRHHLQGVEMANLALTRSQDATVLQLAFDISATQTNQVGRMQGWLSLWGLPLTSGSTMAWMGGHDDHSAGGAAMAGSSTLMPGMATEDELAQLRDLSGQPFDVLFLQLMTRHHQGGLDMAEYAEADAEVDVVRGLARSIALTQTAEVGTMVQMLADRGAEPLPAP